jgi:ATP-dependent DNA helicase DinG
MREAIADANGNEIFFVGKPGENGQIYDVRTVCRGGPRSVMVLFSVPQFGDVVIHNHPSGVLLPSRADEEIAGRFDGKGVGFFIINNEVDDLYALVEPFREEEPHIELNEDEMVALLGPEGPLARHLPHYEERHEQQEMLRHLVRSFNDEKLLMVEAGTGTGKSLAYLLPAVYWARRNRQRVLISTNTINLQQQLCNKDIPFLQRVLDEPFRAVLVKGRQNYMCLRKLHQQAADSQLHLEDEYEDLQMLLQWAQQTGTGDRADLSFVPQEQLWSAIKAESDTCQRTRCEYYRSCFYYMARRKQASADILVTNHHIFFADLALRHATGNYHAAALLPPYQRVILDEAHNIEDAASSFMGHRVTRMGVLRALGMLLKVNRKRQEGGLLMQVADQLFKQQQGIRQAEDLRQQIFETVLPTVRRQRKQTMWFCEQLHRILHDGGNGQEPSVIKLRVTENMMQRGPWRELQEIGLDWSDELQGLVNELLRLYHRLEQATSRQSRTFSGFLMDLEGAASRLGGAAAALSLFFRNGDNDEDDDVNQYVRWFELDGRDAGKIRLHMAPLEIGASMRRMLYEHVGSVAFTSATLATDQKDFSYIAERIGLTKMPEDRVSQAMFPSPFAYQHQSLVCIPRDIPNPKDADFDDVIVPLIYRAIEASDGRAFVLCTSFRLMTFLHQQLADRLKDKMGIRSLCQGEAPRHVLLQQKIDDPRSVLFGTDSFWEGVDVRGEALVNVILTRLPFRVPSEPLIEARMEAIESRGGNSFLRYTVPAATIKFKQGFGRLIRSREDRGTVLILDKRVVQKSYGKRFLRALPEDCPQVIGTTDHVMGHLMAFHRQLRAGTDTTS